MISCETDGVKTRSKDRNGSKQLILHTMNVIATQHVSFTALLYSSYDPDSQKLTVYTKIQFRSL